jgi:hypothetical protein
MIAEARIDRWIRYPGGFFAETNSHSPDTGVIGRKQ